MLSNQCNPAGICRPRWFEELLQTAWPGWLQEIPWQVLEPCQVWARLVRNFNAKLARIMVFCLMVVYFASKSFWVCLFPMAVETKLHTLVGSEAQLQVVPQQPLFTFLGRPIGRLCLCKVLGVGINRFRKALSMTPDLRIGARKGERHAASQSVNAFLGILYDGVAETLPDRYDFFQNWISNTHWSKS